MLAAYDRCAREGRPPSQQKCEYCKSRGYTHQGWCQACWKWWNEHNRSPAAKPKAAAAKLKAADAEPIRAAAGKPKAADAKACVAACKAAAAAARPAGFALSLNSSPAAEPKAAPASAGSAQPEVASGKPETAATPKAAAAKSRVFKRGEQWDRTLPRNWHPTYVTRIQQRWAQPSFPAKPTFGWDLQVQQEVQQWGAFRAQGIEQIKDATGPPWWRVTPLQ